MKKTQNTAARALALACALIYLSGCMSPGKIEPAAARIPPEAPAQGKASSPEANTHSRRLFTIERNKNANVVHYDANLTADGKLNPRAPVVAYWVLLAEDGRRKNLNWVEKKKAYGIRVKADPAHNGYILTLAAAAWMPLAVREIEGAVRVEVDINGRPAALQKMFIQSRDRLMGPKVEYIELYGKDLQTGELRREKIIPK